MIDFLKYTKQWGDMSGIFYLQYSQEFLLVTTLISLAVLGYTSLSPEQEQIRSKIYAEIERLALHIKDKVIAWRRDLHQHPELSNREFRTSKLIADHLQSLGIQVRTEVAHTGVVGLLEGNQPGPVVALRADIDALPVTEETGLPFASKARGTYNGNDVGVMHACGHDFHTSILMGAAEILAAIKDQLPGSLKFIFQPAEEGPPQGEEGGAPMMVREGVLENPKPGAVFGLHVIPFLETGTIGYRPGGTMASTDELFITVRGSQTHGAIPWAGVDPVVVAAQIILGLQTITSRQLDITNAPAIVTICIIQGGVRNNIIPDEVKMSGTIRALDPDMHRDIHLRIIRTAKNIAESAGATAEVSIIPVMNITFNNPELTRQMLPTLERTMGEKGILLIPPITGAEDFSVFAEKVPGLFFFLGVSPKGSDVRNPEPWHSPRFCPDEGALIYGVRAMANIAVDYILGK